MKIAAIDVETTGLDAKRCAITQIAILPIINGVKGEPFVSYVRPHEGASISEEALKIQKKTYEEVMSYPPAEEVMEELLKWLDENGNIFYLLGQNVKFDRDFLYNFFTRMGRHTDYIIRFRPDLICTLTMARTYFEGKRNKPEKMNLGSLCKFFNISLENAHDALDDIKATVELYYSLEALIQKPIIAPKEELTYHQKRLKYLGAGYCMINEDGSVYLNPSVTKDKDALEFVLGELYEIFKL